jgi:NAD(P)H-nitrite reductase large subunit
VDPNQEICLCFHVSAGKVQRFIQVEKPIRASQLSECFGAGTGCGWCRPFLRHMFDAAQTDQVAQLPDPDVYAEQRETYRETKEA